MKTATTSLAEVKKLAKTLTYKEIAQYLDKKGVRTPTGLRPNYSFVNNIMAGQVTFRKRKN